MMQQTIRSFTKSRRDNLRIVLLIGVSLAAVILNACASIDAPTEVPVSEARVVTPQKNAERAVASVTKPIVRMAIWEDFAIENLREDIRWQNVEEIANNQKDDDNNGVVDDIFGMMIDAHGKLRGHDFYLGRTSPPATVSHGSAVAWLASKYLNKIDNLARIQVLGSAFVPTTKRLNDSGLLKLSPEARIKQLTQELVQLKKSVILPIDYFKMQNVRVVNMSWGLNFRDMLLKNQNLGRNHREREHNMRLWFDVFNKVHYDAIKAAPDILFVVAVGNDGVENTSANDAPSSLLNLPNVIRVGALGTMNNILDFSNYGDQVDIYAPGHYVAYRKIDGDFEVGEGTSLAAALVSNLAMRFLVNNPNLTASELKQLILSKSLPIENQEKIGRYLPKEVWD